MKLSIRVRDLQSSPTIGAGEAVRKLMASGEDVVRFDVGEPDFETPTHIKEAGITAIAKGFTHYTSARGIPELRDALVADQKGMGLDAKSSNIAFYPGSKFGLFSILSLLVDSGDEVLIQDPVWPTYASIIEYLGGTPVRIDSSSDDGSANSLAQSFEERITERTKAVLIDSPCNPTGERVGTEQLEDLLESCGRKGIALVLDRIYSALIYDGLPDSIPNCNIEDGNLIIVSGFSKEFAMTGWRLGYTIASEAFTDLLVNLQDNTATCAPSFVQKAGVAALTGERTWQKAMVDEYRARRDVMIAEMERIRGWQCIVPSGAFYCFPRVSDPDSSAFASALLDKMKVSSVAGVYFGPRGQGHLRLSYTTPRDRIVEGMRRIREFVG